MDSVEGFPMRTKRAIESVVVVDPDLVHAENLKEALVAAGCKVSVHPDPRNAVEALAAEEVDALVIVPRSRSWWMQDLKNLRDALTRLDNLPEILCLLRWPSEGPTDRLYGDQLDVRVLHER
jgi:CheY-like chemotaxis protein